MNHVFIRSPFKKWKRIWWIFASHNFNLWTNLLFGIWLDFNCESWWNFCSIIRKKPNNFNLISAYLFKFWNMHHSSFWIHRYKILKWIKGNPIHRIDTRVFPSGNSTVCTRWKLRYWYFLVRDPCLKGKIIGCLTNNINFEGLLLITPFKLTQCRLNNIHSVECIEIFCKNHRAWNVNWR